MNESENGTGAGAAGASSTGKRPRECPLTTEAVDGQVVTAIDDLCAYAKDLEDKGESAHAAKLRSAAVLLGALRDMLAHAYIECCNRTAMANSFRQVAASEAEQLDEVLQKNTEYALQITSLETEVEQLKRSVATLEERHAALERSADVEALRKHEANFLGLQGMTDHLIAERDALGAERDLLKSRFDKQGSGDPSFAQAYREFIPDIEKGYKELIRTSAELTQKKREAVKALAQRENAAAEVLTDLLELLRDSRVRDRLTALAAECDDIHMREWAADEGSIEDCDAKVRARLRQGVREAGDLHSDTFFEWVRKFQRAWPSLYPAKSDMDRMEAVSTVGQIVDEVLKPCLVGLMSKAKSPTVVFYDFRHVFINQVARDAWLKDEYVLNGSAVLFQRAMTGHNLDLYTDRRFSYTRRGEDGPEVTVVETKVEAATPLSRRLITLFVERLEMCTAVWAAVRQTLLSLQLQYQADADGRTQKAVSFDYILDLTELMKKCFDALLPVEEHLKILPIYACLQFESKYSVRRPLPGGSGGDGRVWAEYDEMVAEASTDATDAKEEEDCIKLVRITRPSDGFPHLPLDFPSLLTALAYGGCPQTIHDRADAPPEDDPLIQMNLLVMMSWLRLQDDVNAAAIADGHAMTLDGAPVPWRTLHDQIAERVLQWWRWRKDDWLEDYRPFRCPAGQVEGEPQPSSSLDK